MESIVLDIAGVRVRFRTDFAELAAYARSHLSPLEVTNEVEPDIISELVWLEGVPPKNPDAVFPQCTSLERIDRDLYRDDGKLVWLRIDDLRDLKMRFVLEDQHLRVSGRYYFHLSKEPVRDMVKRVVYHKKLSRERQRRFTTLLYYLVYYPALWWLEARRGIHPLHGGAVATEKGGILLAGPGGVGKSTLTVAVTAFKDARFLSDTFILYDSCSLYPMVEPVLLDTKSAIWLQDGMEKLTEIPEYRDCGYGRKGYHVASSHCSQSTPVSLVLLPHRSPRALVTSLSVQACAARIIAYNEIIGDLRRYWVLSAVMSLLENNTDYINSRTAALYSVLGNAACYDFGFPPGLGRDEMLHDIFSLLPNRIEERSLH
jgi:hypothetical protein